MASYVGESERYNLIMHETSKRVHATNIYEEYEKNTIKPKDNPDDNEPKFNGSLFIGKAIKNVTTFCNIKSILDKKLLELINTLIGQIQKEIDMQIK